MSVVATSHTCPVTGFDITSAAAAPACASEEELVGFVKIMTISNEERKTEGAKAAAGDAAGDSASLAADSPMSLTELVSALDEYFSVPRTEPLHMQEEVSRLLARYDASTEDWKRYSFFDVDKRYTRNLIATDNQNYTLLALCWNKGQESPVHDHPCNGCFVRVLQGAVCETRYAMPSGGETGSLQVTKVSFAHEGDMCYMHDRLGLHKIGSVDCDAVTLHLYAPPYKQCRVWMNETDCSKVCLPCVTYYSEYGEKVCQ